MPAPAPTFTPDEAGLHTDPREAGAPTIWRVLAWAFFLGCSWTWVIGMFFPLLLVRDLGVAGWWAFAVPNVVGAAAMGWVLARRHALSIRRHHAPALRWFSDVTIGFHVLVFFWLVTKLFGPVAWAAMVLPLLVWIPARRRRVAAWLPWIAIPVAGLSWACFSMLNATPIRIPGEAAGVVTQAWNGVHDQPLLGDWSAGNSGVWFFLFPSLLGFLLCPYADASFNRARAALDPAGSRWQGAAAFTLGFGVVFGSMIVFSLMYAGVLGPAFRGGEPRLTPVWQILLATHICLQGAFTVTVHLRERCELDPDSRRTAGLALPVGFALAVALLASAADAGRIDLAGALAPVLGSEPTPGMTLGEWGYRVFLLFYGAVFPGYVWLRMVSGPRFPGILARRAAPATLAVGCTGAFALAYLAFIGIAGETYPWAFPASALWLTLAKLGPTQPEPPPRDGF